jgi:hypothetical protein
MKDDQQTQGPPDDSFPGPEFTPPTPEEVEARTAASVRRIAAAIVPELKAGLETLRRDEIAARLVGSLIEGNHPANDDTIRKAFELANRIREIGKETAK